MSTPRTAQVCRETAETKISQMTKESAIDDLVFMTLEIPSTPPRSRSLSICSPTGL